MNQCGIRWTGKKNRSLTNQEINMSWCSPTHRLAVWLPAGWNTARVAPFWNAGERQRRGKSQSRVQSLKKITTEELYFICFQLVFVLFISPGASCLCSVFWRYYQASTPLLSGWFLHTAAAPLRSEPDPGQTCSSPVQGPLQRHPLSEQLTMAGKLHSKACQRVCGL